MDSLNSGASDQDDFEFKPLTEGLGFHQKKNTPVKPMVQFKSEMPELEISSPLNSPLPRANKKAVPTGNATDKTTSKITHNTTDKAISFRSPTDNKNNTVDEILKTLNEKRNVDFSNKKEKLKTPTASFKPSPWDLSASMLDAMLVTAASLFCLILLLVITRVDLFANVYHPDAGGMVYWSLLALLGTVAWIYLVGHRVFLGFTPGEWVFDQRLGKPEDNASVSYMMKTILRSTLVIVTGFIVFPLVSFAMNDDLLGKLVGLRLMKRA